MIFRAPISIDLPYLIFDLVHDDLAALRTIQTADEALPQAGRAAALAHVIVHCRRDLSSESLNRERHEVSKPFGTRSKNRIELYRQGTHSLYDSRHIRVAAIPSALTSRLPAAFHF